MHMYLFLFISTFTKDDVLVQIDQGSFSFVVTKPNTNTPVSATALQDAISGDIESRELSELGLTLSVPKPTTTVGDDEVDWPLILGLTIAGTLLFLAVIVSIIM